jgi:flavin-dependent dehydrogenase
VTAYDTDVLVAGGGPVGLMAALEARRRGFDVTVVEPRADPVDKACGEGLMPTALARLHRLGIDPSGRPFDGITYVADGRRVTARFTDGPGRGVRRTTLHQAVAAAAADSGVRRVQGRVEGVVQDDRSVRAASLRARWLLAADGLHSPIRRSLGLDRPASARKRWGLRRHFDVEPWSDTVEVHWSESVEAYVTPVGPRVIGIAVLTSTPGVGHDAWLEAFPALRERVAGAGCWEVRGAGPLAQRAAARVAGRVLLVGDAAGYVDALTGEGLAVGWAGAEAAARCLALGRPQDYEAAWRSVVRRSWWLTLGLLTVTRHPAVRARLVPAAAALPGVYRRLVNQLA